MQNSGWTATMLSPHTDPTSPGAFQDGEDWPDIAFHAARDGMLICEPPAGAEGGRILHANPAVCRLLGYAPAELRAMRLPQLAGGAGRSTAMSKDGRPVAVEIEIQPFHRRGRALALALIRQDVPGRADEMLKVITDAAPVLISYIDSEFRYRLANRTYERWFGLLQDQIAGRHVSDVLGPAAWEKVRPYMERALAGEDVSFELELPYRGGGPRWVHVSYVPDRSMAGRVSGFAVLVQDLSERNRAEESLRRFELLAAHSRDIILFLRLSDGRIMDANAAACDAYGYSREELLSRTIYDLREPRTRELVQAQMSRADLETILFETVHVRKDGSTFPVEVNSAGATIGGERTVISVIRDISARLKAQEALRRSEERFRRAVENIPDLAVIYDRELRIQYVNPAVLRLTGRPAFELIGRRDEEVFGPEVRQAYVATLRAVLETRTVRSVEADVVLPGAGPRLLRFTGVPLMDEDGEVHEVLGVAHDFTERRVAEERIRSAAQFPDQNPSPVLRIGADGTLLFANRAADGLLAEWGSRAGGRAPEFLAGAARRVLAERVSRELEIEIGGRDFSFILTPIADRDYVNLYGRDVTDRNAAERVLSEAKERQELLTSVVARLLASEDPQGIVNDLAGEVMVKLGCDAFFNYLVDSGGSRLRLNAYGGVSGRPAPAIERLEFGAAVCGCVAQQGVRIVAEGIQQGADPRTGLVRSLGIRAYACHPLQAGGKTIGTLSFGSRAKDRFTDDELSLMQAVTNQIAIAMERVRAQRLLRESEERYRAIARSIPGGAVWVVDAELRYLIVEGALAAHMGLAREEMEGRTVAAALPEPERALVEERFRRALAGESASYESDHGDLRLWSQYAPLRDEDGRVLAAMALTLDITERARMEARLLQSQKMESIAVLAGGIAHDFNNLLVGIVGNASLAEDLLPEGSPAAGILQDLVKAGERAAHLTREMLAYAGRGQFVIERVNLSSLVEEITALVRSSVPNQVTLRLDLRPDLPRVEADTAQVQQVVMNLVINAAEAIGDQRGLITVRTRSVDLDAGGLRREWPGTDLKPGPYVELQVADTGCGMDEATRAKIFDPFFTTKFTGRGLGLAAVSGIVRAHKGALKVDSQPGVGSAFSILFPAAPAQPAEPAVKAQTDTDKAAGYARILVVDDEQVVRQLAKTALERLGYLVTAVDGGPAALAELERDALAFDLVVLDLSMPGMSGEEALGRIREIRPDIRVLMSSGYSESECLVRFRRERIAGFLQKPYSAGILAERVRAALRP